MKNKIVKRIFFLMISMLYLLQPLTCYANELTLYAGYAAIVDANTGRVLWGKEDDIQVPMASTTKIMTCIIALEQGNCDDIVTVSSYAQSMPQVRMGIHKGEEYRLEDLLYALMLESYNDVAVAIAEHIAGSVNNFAALMNEKAKQIGCKEYHFITPNGLDGQEMINGNCMDHSISARDLAKVMSYCCQHSPKKKEFIRITRTTSITITDHSKKRSFSLSNHNQMLTNEKVVSGKTGFTGRAGYCYVSLIKEKEHPIAIALLACGWPNHKTYKWKDMNQILQFLSSNLREYVCCMEDVTISDCYVKNAQHEIGEGIGDKKIKQIGLQQIDGKTYLGLKNEQIRYKVSIKKILDAPVKKDTVIGTLNVYLGEALMEEIPIYVTENYLKNSYSRCFLRCVDKFLTICINNHF